MKGLILNINDWKLSGIEEESPAVVYKLRRKKMGANLNFTQI